VAEIFPLLLFVVVCIGQHMLKDMKNREKEQKQGCQTTISPRESGLVGKSEKSGKGKKKPVTKVTGL